ncbi:hypothetical protein [Luteirhabdus pelagi]|uniref:hypothetical protein n=1 Tax=Luteirhabdus pelagi TaxID=2792783 RepID=UPI00193AB2CE|nr:hypothetical protein [Luteirhabdus pelagi]
MTNKESILQKFNMLALKKPLGIDVIDINPIELYNETQNDESLKEKLNQFGQIFSGLEGLKQFVVPYYNSNSNKIHTFRDAIFYNELVQVQVFFEFIKDIQIDSSSSPNLNNIFQNKTNQRLNKIRNAIAHFDWKLNEGKIIFKDKNFERKEDYSEISEFCSLLSIIGIFMTNNINKID